MQQKRQGYLAFFSTASAGHKGKATAQLRVYDLELSVLTPPTINKIRSHLFKRRALGIGIDATRVASRRESRI